MFFSKLNNRKISIVASLMIIALIVDMMCGTFFDVLGSQLSSTSGTIVFTTVIVMLYGIGPYVLLEFTKKTTIDLVTRSKLFSILYLLTKISQYALMIIFATIILQIVFVSHYYLGLIGIANTIGCTTAVILLALLGYRFFSWFKSNKKNIMILLLGLSATMGTTAALGNVILINELMLEKSGQPQSTIDFQKFNTELNLILRLTMGVPLVLAFLFEWGGIAILIHRFSKKIGHLKYWLIISLPLASFLAGITPTMLASPSSNYAFFEPNMLLFRIITTLGAAGGYFIMGFAYLSVAKSVNQIDKKSVASYMTISGFGVIMLSISFQSPGVVDTIHPPFGTAAHWFVGIASYLFSMGFYSSAISVSEDAKLRQSIRKYAMAESKLLDSIGTAQMEHEVQKKVINLAKNYSDEMTKDTGISPSLTEEDMNQYLVQVIKEIKEHKSSS